VCVTQGGYLAGVLALAHSLKAVESTRPLVVMHLEDVPALELGFLHTAGIRTIQIERIPNPNCRQEKSGSRPCARGRDNYSKLALFSLTQFRCAL
jgi:hypothetical protein